MEIVVVMLWETTMDTTTFLPRTLRAIAVLCTLASVTLSFATESVSPAQAAGPRPNFQLPVSNGQEWDASTYANHGPDPDRLDFTVRDDNLANIGRGEPILASTAGIVARSRIKPGDGLYSD